MASGLAVTSTFGSPTAAALRFLPLTGTRDTDRGLAPEVQSDGPH